MGGEKLILYTDRCVKPGSPPRGRGKVFEALQPLAAWGITPAWAGKSFDSLTVCRRLRDHPRVGGEKTKKIP